MSLPPPTTKEIEITTHPNMRMNQNHRVTTLLESAFSVDHSDGLEVIAITATGFKNLYINLMYLKILSKKVQNIFNLIFL